MSRLIDADACIDYIRNNNQHAWEALAYAPTIDAVEVVRCRDCIHWFPHTQCGFDEDYDEYHDYCGLLIPDDDYYAYRRKANDYCSYGERREDGEEE